MLLRGRWTAGWLRHAPKTGVKGGGGHTGNLFIGVAVGVQGDFPNPLHDALPTSPPGPSPVVSPCLLLQVHKSVGPVTWLLRAEPALRQDAELPAHGEAGMAYE